MEQWRLLITPALPGALNMAIDAAIADFVAAGNAPPTLRFYDWQPYCLSLGHHQNFAEVDKTVCKSKRIDVVRRPTGGRAVYHAEEFTYAVIVPKTSRLFRNTVLANYLLIADWLIAGLAHLGIRAAYATGANLRAHQPIVGNSTCFARASDYEILVDGRKLVGSAQRRWSTTALQHGSILVGDEHLQIVELLCLTPAERLKMLSLLQRRTTFLRQHLVQLPTLMEFAGELGKLWQQKFGVEVVAGELSDAEQVAAEQCCDRYRLFLPRGKKANAQPSLIMDQG